MCVLWNAILRFIEDKIKLWSVIKFVAGIIYLPLAIRRQHMNRGDVNNHGTGQLALNISDIIPLLNLGV